MGADIYLESVNGACREAWEHVFKDAVKKRDASKTSAAKARWQKKVEEAWLGMYAGGYFRDNYNGYGLFAQTQLSWWRDVIPMLNEEGYLPIDRAEELKAMVLAEKLDLSSARKVAAEQKEDPPTIQEYEGQRDELIKILDQSIALGEPLRCSL